MNRKVDNPYQQYDEGTHTMARLIKRTQRTVSNVASASMDVLENIVNGTADVSTDVVDGSVDLIKGTVRSGRYIIDILNETGSNLPSATEMGAKIYNGIVSTLSDSEEEASIYAEIDKIEAELELQQLRNELARKQAELDNI